MQRASMQQGEETELRLQVYGNEDSFTGTQKGLHRACLTQEIVAVMGRRTG